MPGPVPRSVLPADGGVVHILDSRSGRRVAAPGQEPRGSTPAASSPLRRHHLGHAFTYLGVDLLNRALVDTGHGVRYVQNVTDVDDPLLERAEATGADWRDLAEEQTELFRADMTALRVLPPEPYLGVVVSPGRDRRLPAAAPGGGRALPGGRPGLSRLVLRHDHCRTRRAHPAGGPGDLAERGGDPIAPGKRNP
ncbi:MAG: hypothetical protein KIT69_01605 [Propionibacteriaceae bacterium]|nr:hypothetical protein [Propionibacteriaceae bacterium]